MSNTEGKQLRMLDPGGIYITLAEGARDFLGFVVLLSSTFQSKVGQNCLKYKICEIAAHN